MAEDHGFKPQKSHKLCANTHAHLIPGSGRARAVGNGPDLARPNTGVLLLSAKHPTRCLTCRKRVGLTGFGCRCGSMFCGTHRYPEQHGCTFDYKKVGKEAIAKANPLVKAQKLDRI